MKERRVTQKKIKAVIAKNFRRIAITCLYSIYLAVIFFLFVKNRGQVSVWYTFDQVFIISLVFAASEAWVLFRDKHTHLERRLIYSAWIFVLTFNVLSIISRDSQTAFGEVVYKAILLFMGEWSFSDTVSSLEPLGIGRFLALIVTSGSVLIVLLREKFIYWKIRRFYSGSIIISDTPEGYIMDLAKSIMAQEGDDNRVVIGYTSPVDHQYKNKDSAVPIISINVEDEKSLNFGLEACNIENAKTIYLLNSETEINVQIAKQIYKLYHEEESQRLVKNMKDSIENIQKKHLNNNESALRNELKKVIKNVWGQGTGESKLCYIQYRTDEERNFYSFDEAFNHINRNFNTCFINPYDISIRQMISCSKIGKSISVNDIDQQVECMQASITKEQALIKTLENTRILVAGSRQLLRRTLFEISRIAIYNNTLPYTIYYLDCNVSGMDESAIDKLIDLKIDERHFSIQRIKPESVVTDLGRIKQFYISSTSESEIRRLIEVSFQHGIGNITDEIFITTKGSDSEYEILNNYIKALFNKDIIGDRFKHTVYISRVTDLLIRFQDFNKKFGSKTVDVFINYILNASIDENNKITSTRFDRMPEIFKDSTLMSVLHDEFLMDVIERLDGHVDFSVNGDLENASEAIKYLSVTEHNRWFNERSLQGYMYHPEKNHLINKNPSLREWKLLTEELRKTHNDYIIPTLKRGVLNRKNVEIQSDLIRTITVEETFREESYDISAKAN